ncbi:ABC transporter substrate-binding protein [Microbacterium sp. YY-03]|uniref:ABC transporter substrate-binding protein n=1 Tax=Microbacterium sp. YY-03 TaxID=3421636 RepID=UPI003D17F74D
MSKNSTRMSVAVAGLAAAALAVSGCSSDSSSGDGGTTGDGNQVLTVLHKWPEGAHAEYFEKIIADFEAETGITVEATAVQDDPYKERIRVLTGSNSLPDVFFVWPGAFGEQFFDAGLVEDLTEPMSDGWADSLVAPAIDAYTHDGKIYAVPVSMSGKFFTYNTAMFADAGIEVPQTYDDLIQACEAFQAEGITPISMGNNAMWPGVHYLTTLIGKYVPQDEMLKDFDPATATFTDPGYVKAIETLTELADKCFTPGANGISNDSAKAEIQTGVVPMYYGESNIFSMFRESNGATAEVAADWDFFAFPDIEGAAGDQDSLTGAPDGFVINSKSENKEAAEKFLRYITTKESGALLLEMRDRPSAVIGAEEGVADVLPQLERALTVLDETDTFNIWLDTATDPQVGAAWLAAGQAAIDGSVSPEDIIASVKAASDSVK